MTKNSNRKILKAKRNDPQRHWTMSDKPQSAENESKESRNGMDNHFDLPPLERAEKLVNNEYMADAVFKVGESGTLMYAHQVIITTASEVFYAQFNGQFAESNRDLHSDPIAITDIEAEPFLEVLRYMYCRKANLEPGNMLDVYYAAEKYMLSGLQLLCENAFYRDINEDNVLQVFQHNRRYGFPIADKICLAIIRDNPLKLFEQQDFLTVDRTALEMIASSAKINCQVEQLKTAIEQWESKNGRADISLKPSGRMCRKLTFFSQGWFSSTINTCFTFTVGQRIDLYGIGILIGAKSDSVNLPGSVTIELTINDALLTSKVVPISDDIETHEIMFEKISVTSECKIQVNVKKPDHLRIALFCLDGCDSVNVSQGVNVKFSNVSKSNYEYRSYQNYSYVYREMNCVSYLLYQVAKPAIE